MRPCRQCGAPIENRTVVCPKCGGSQNGGPKVNPGPPAPTRGPVRQVVHDLLGSGVPAWEALGCLLAAPRILAVTVPPLALGGVIGYFVGGVEGVYVGVLAAMVVAVGVAAVFIETHPDPDKAPSDGPNMIPLRDMRALIVRLKAFDALAKAR